MQNITDIANAEEAMDFCDSTSSEPHANKKNFEVEPQLSKRQLRKQLKREKWEKLLPAKRAKEKLKEKLKRANARLNNIDLGPSKKELKRNKMSTSSCKVRVAVDMAFDDLMIDKDIAKCNKQLLRCYSFNRRAENPLQFYITSFTGKSQAVMAKHDGYVNWDVNMSDKSYTDLFKSEECVYLSSESENIISELDDTKVYIIGGLVDHNSQKGLCHSLAKEKGIAHARLPIGESVNMSTRKVLTINHVFEILVSVSQGSSWQEAIVNALPQRKGAVVKEGNNNEDSDEEQLLPGHEEDKNEKQLLPGHEEQLLPSHEEDKDEDSEECKMLTGQSANKDKETLLMTC